MAADNCNIPNTGCGPDPCASGPGLVPVSEETYQRSVGVRVQTAVDRARRHSTRLGLRPYQVFLVFQERAADRLWREVHRVELTPCRIPAMDATSRELTESGMVEGGGIAVTEVSPAQVSENLLRGELPAGIRWGADTGDREVFFEVVRRKRCPSDPEPPRHRYVLGSEVHYDAEGFQLRFLLTAQRVPRDSEGADQSLAIRRKHLAKLVT